MSIVVRRSLGAQLRRMREQAGKSVADVAQPGIMVKETLLSIEAGKRRVKPIYVETLCRIYSAGNGGVDQKTIDRLVAMANNVTRGGWWEDYDDIIDPEFKFYVQVEAEADEVVTYDAELPYGMLQTPAYHRAIFEAEPFPPKSVDREIQFRVDRQRATLGRTNPMRIRTVLNEAVLVRQVGGRKVMAQLREHLLKLNAQPTIDLNVLPWRSGAHAAMGGPFQIVSFDDPDAPDVGYLETYEGVRYLEGDDKLQKYRDRFASVLRQSVPLEEYLR